jgi:formiminoglutamase
VAAWFSLLEPATVELSALRREDDPRLGDIIERWDGRLTALRRDRAVLIGFPQDEGVRRNGGRVGAAQAPDAIRKWLYRLTAGDCRHQIDLAAAPPLDMGNVRVTPHLEEAQASLAIIVGRILNEGLVPVVMGGGHETAYPHYLGSVIAGPVGIVNIDAHLDVRPLVGGLGHSGSPFRQAMEDPSNPLARGRYCCLGAQPFAVSAAHARFLEERGDEIVWAADIDRLDVALARAIQRPAFAGCHVMLSIDADAFRAADVPGVSAPNVAGLAGVEAFRCARAAGAMPVVSTIELVEVNPEFDIDGRSARWAAAVIWHFLVSLANRVGQAGKLP